MRHSFASWHIDRSRNAKWVQQQLGHTKLSTTLDIYAHWFRQVDARAADDLGAALVGADGNSAGNRG